MYKTVKTFLLFISFILLCGISGAKRLAPERVEPVIHDGVKYTAPAPNSFFSNEGKLDSDAWDMEVFEKRLEDRGKMGIIEAWDVWTGKKLWEKKIYRIEYHPYLERDVQDVFIRSLRLKKDRLIIENEAEDIYELDLKTLEISVRRYGKWKPGVNREVCQ